LTKLKYVDDAEFARRFARDRARRGYGPVYIQSALRQKGLKPDFIRESLKDEEAEEDPVDAAVRAVRACSAFRRKPKAGEDPRRRTDRCYAFLARRGFGTSVIISALRKATKEDIEL
jgi:SOS response regulatory protein OraA/RecX